MDRVQSFDCIKPSRITPGFYNHGVIRRAGKFHAHLLDILELGYGIVNRFLTFISPFLSSVLVKSMNDNVVP